MTEITFWLHILRVCFFMIAIGTIIHFIWYFRK